jgi:dephospho-CoA kinase
MRIIGLTGSIGMGKTAAARRFRTLGINVCDADAEVHRLYRSTAIAPIEAAFPGTTSTDGVDRPKLLQALLADPTGFKRLEAIVHPLVWAAERDFLHEECRRGAEIAVLEIPLLLEGKGGSRVDAVVVVSAPIEHQRVRVLARPGMTPEKMAEILSRQMPDDEKRRLADFVVDTGGTYAETEAQIDKVVAEIRTWPATAFVQHWA